MGRRLLKARQPRWVRRTGVSERNGSNQDGEKAEGTNPCDSCERTDGPIKTNQTGHGGDPAGGRLSGISPSLAGRHWPATVAGVPPRYSARIVTDAWQGYGIGPSVSQRSTLPDLRSMRSSLLIADASRSAEEIEARSLVRGVAASNRSGKNQATPPASSPRNIHQATTATEPVDTMPLAACSKP